MALEDLDPAALLRTVAVLEVAKLFVNDVLRGRAVTAEEVTRVRQAVRSCLKTLDALDDAKPWEM